jgi:C-terminal processing protease CtpA/Prc
MLSQHYWNTHTSAPLPSEYNKFKIMNNANYEWFKNEVKNGIEGLCLVTNPKPKTFKGKIFILTSELTASASEPLVYTLQKENIATVIGGKTAGAMVSMEVFNVQNLAFTIPILDYYTFDGKRLDKIGVEPNIKCDPKDALAVALKMIKDGK